MKKNFNMLGLSVASNMLKTEQKFSHKFMHTYNISLPFPLEHYQDH